MVLVQRGLFNCNAVRFNHDAKQSCVQVIPIDEKGQLHEAFNMRIDELNVIDMIFLEGCAKPTIAVLYQDNKDARHIKTYEVVLKEKVWPPY